MEPHKILSANILDLIFDNRNKEYGAYELRVTYPERVKKSLIVVFIIAAVAMTGAALANSFKPRTERKLYSTEVTIRQIEPDKKEPIPPPEPKKPEPIQTKTVQFTTPVVVKEDAGPLPEISDMDNAKIDLKTEDGSDYNGIKEAVRDVDNGTGIIEPPKDEYTGPAVIVEVDAKFNGNWEKFLIRNLNANVPVDNGAPAGRYTVLIQFVVDLEGNVSDIKPLTAHGYGMEEEAARVLKKALKWEPAFQNGHHVKAYRKQPITFVVEESN